MRSSRWKRTYDCSGGTSPFIATRVRVTGSSRRIVCPLTTRLPPPWLGLARSRSCGPSWPEQGAYLTSDLDLFAGRDHHGAGGRSRCGDVDVWLCLSVGVRV